MYPFIFLFLFSFIKLYSFEGQEAFLKSIEINESLKKHVIEIYSQELLKAGIHDDSENAYYAAEQECMLDLFNNPDKQLQALQILSYNCFEKYGYLVYSFQDKEKIHVEMLWLEPKHRGRGLAKSALFALEKRLAASEAKTIDLHVFEHNYQVFWLFRNMGYEIKQSFAFNGKNISHQMFKNLEKPVRLSTKRTCRN